MIAASEVLLAGFPTIFRLVITRFSLKGDFPGPLPHNTIDIVSFIVVCKVRFADKIGIALTLSYQTEGYPTIVLN